MKTCLTAAALLLAGCAVPPTTQTPAQTVEASAALSFSDLPDMSGEGWSGTLDYLDYSSGERTSIPIDVSIAAIQPRRVRYDIKFPGESQYNARERISLSRDGRSINGERVLSSNARPGGGLEIVTLEQGRDDGQAADIRRTYRLGARAFTIRKDIDLRDGNGYFNRNVFSLKR